MVVILMSNEWGVAGAFFFLFFLLGKMRGGR